MENKQYNCVRIRLDFVDVHEMMDNDYYEITYNYKFDEVRYHYNKIDKLSEAMIYSIEGLDAYMLASEYRRRKIRDKANEIRVNYIESLQSFFDKIEDAAQNNDLALLLTTVYSTEIQYAHNIEITELSSHASKNICITMTCKWNYDELVKF